MAFCRTNCCTTFLFISLLFLTFEGILSECYEDDLYVIKSTPSGMVVDCSDPSQLQIQNYSGNPDQLWTFERASRPGLFYIINRLTGMVLDITECNVEACVAYLNALDTSPKQEWMLTSKGRIWNAYRHENLVVWNANYTAGNYIITNVDDSRPEQGFTLQEKTAFEASTIL